MMLVELFEGTGMWVDPRDIKSLRIRHMVANRWPWDRGNNKPAVWWQLTVNRRNKGEPLVVEYLTEPEAREAAARIAELTS